eukprot:scaffold4036_cov236-Pinguiococcus_pyrenoidosus.AAC.3
MSFVGAVAKPETEAAAGHAGAASLVMQNCGFSRVLINDLPCSSAPIKRVSRLLRLNLLILALTHTSATAVPLGLCRDAGVGRDVHPFLTIDIYHSVQRILFFVEKGSQRSSCCQKVPVVLLPQDRAGGVFGGLAEFLQRTDHGLKRPRAHDGSNSAGLDIHQQVVQGLADQRAQAGVTKPSLAQDVQKLGGRLQLMIAREQPAVVLVRGDVDQSTAGVAHDVAIGMLKKEDKGLVCPRLSHRLSEAFVTGEVAKGPRSFRHSLHVQTQKDLQQHRGDCELSLLENPPTTPLARFLRLPFPRSVDDPNERVPDVPLALTGREHSKGRSNFTVNGHVRQQARGLHQCVDQQVVGRVLNAHRVLRGICALRFRRPRAGTGEPRCLRLGGDFRKRVFV